jgi:hypothetical protein
MRRKLPQGKHLLFFFFSMLLLSSGGSADEVLDWKKDGNNYLSEK